MSVQNLDNYGEFLLIVMSVAVVIDLQQTCAQERVADANLFLSRIPDPFADEVDLLEGKEEVGSQENNIHIRIQQRNGRKTLTTLQGLSKGVFLFFSCNEICSYSGSAYNLKKILKAFKKEFACNGNLVEDEVFGQVIQLQGDQRQKILNFNDI